MSRKPFEVFTAADCKKIAHTLEGLAWGDDSRYMQQAVPLLMTHFNAILNERGKRVYGRENHYKEVWDWSDDKCMAGTDTHEALLIAERPIKEEE